jgi:hypothetical protein
VDKLHELTWKSRFVERLAELFSQQGLDARAAVADAHAHSDDCYPGRKDGEPKSEAEIVFQELQASTF